MILLSSMNKIKQCNVIGDSHVIEGLSEEVIFELRLLRPAR